MNYQKLQQLASEAESYDGYNTKYPKVWVTKFFIQIIFEIISLIISMEEYVKSEISSLNNSMDSKFSNVNTTITNLQKDVVDLKKEVAILKQKLNG